MLLGCIADDFTGATDLANTLVKGGMRTVQAIGVPASDGVAAHADAVVVALKSRTIPAADAVAQSLAALAWLRGRGARQVFFKYCSTFDSTDAGNIGPVADALLDALGARFTIACPAYPENRRTIYLGHLFVGDALLSDSPMRDHPLTPMRDASLVRVLARQTRRRVGLVPWPVVARGAGTIRAEFARLSNEGVAHAIVDAIGDRDLIEIGAACADLALVTGGLRRRARPAAELPRRGPAAGTGRRRRDSRGERAGPRCSPAPAPRRRALRSRRGRRPAPRSRWTRSRAMPPRSRRRRSLRRVPTSRRGGRCSCIRPPRRTWSPACSRDSAASVPRA